MDENWHDILHRVEKLGKKMRSCYREYKEIVKLIDERERMKKDGKI